MYLLIFLRRKNDYPITRTFKSIDEMNGYIRASKEFYENFRVLNKYKIEEEID